MYTKKCRENPDPRPSIPEEDICHPSHSEEEFAKLVPLTIVTAADSEYYEHLTNILGSIQLWEPEAQIAVYDLGLTKQHAEEVRSLCGVELIEFPFEKYPSYVNEFLSNFAWKALVIKEAVDRFGKVPPRTLTHLHIQRLLTFMWF